MYQLMSLEIRFILASLARRDISLDTADWQNSISYISILGSGVSMKAFWLDFCVFYQHSADSVICIA